MAVKPSKGNAGEGFKGTESVFLSYFCFIMFFSPRWQPVDFPVLQAFFPSKTDRQESMRRPVTAYFTNLHEFRHYKLWRGLFWGHTGHTDSKKNKNKPTAKKKAFSSNFLQSHESRFDMQAFVMEKTAGCANVWIFTTVNWTMDFFFFFFLDTRNIAFEL